MTEYTVPMSYHVLILGGGFTGVEVARRLSSRTDIEVTLVNPESHALFTPRLVDALAQACSESDLRFAHKEIATKHGYTFIHGRAISIDQKKKRVILEEANKKQQTLSYDALVCAYGGETNFYQLKGKEQTLPFKTWEHLLALEEQLQPLVRQRKPIHAAVIGGGATGIEIAFALDRRLALLGCKQNRRTISIFQAGPQILPGFLPKTIHKVTTLLKERKMDLFLSTPVTSIDSHQLITQQGDVLDADLVIWAAGIQATTVDGALSSQDGRGAIVVDHTLRLSPGVFAGGDVIQFRDKQQIIPKNAQTALKMGAIIAKNILREREQKPLHSFHYHSFGVLLWLDQTAAIDLFHMSWSSPLIVWLRHQLYTQKWKKIR